MQASWPIVSSGIVVASPLLLAAVGLISVGDALSVSNVLGIIMLAGVGYVGGLFAQEPFPRRLLLALVSAALGFAVVSIEIAVHNH